MKTGRFLTSLKPLSPGQALIFYYALTILIGALLLATPLAANGTRLSFLDALFTATSAQCVTGLSVIDVGTRLSLFGQGVLLALIQIGGLGIMTFSVYLFIYLRVGVSIRGRWIINETLMHSPISSWRELIRDIFVMTMVIETLGTLLLSLVFIPRFGFWQGLYSAVFHSISSFCNAGFSLFSDSMVGFRDQPLVNMTLLTLIVVGGLGFLVIRELHQWVRDWRGKKKRPQRLSLHTRIVLSTTAILIIASSAIIGIIEYDRALAGLPWAEKIWTAVFQAVTARTAGFNSIDINSFAVPTLFLLIFLMFVGASPGSAGGGIKTTSLALFYAILVSRLKGQRSTSLFRRTIPDDAVSRAQTLIMLAIIVIALSLFCLLIVQATDLEHENKRQFLAYVFEVFSAFSTTGLSIGATGQLNAIGKSIIIILMFAGRVGLLTMAFAIAGRTRKFSCRYAEENIMIG